MSMFCGVLLEKNINKTCPSMLPQPLGRLFYEVNWKEL